MNNKFGKWLEEQRKLKGFTQAQFAHECNLSRMSISSFEKGRMKPGIKAIHKIAFALEMEYSDVVKFIL